MSYYHDLKYQPKFVYVLDRKAFRMIINLLMSLPERLQYARWPIPSETPTRVTLSECIPVPDMKFEYLEFQKLSFHMASPYPVAWYGWLCTSHHLEVLD